MTNVQACGNGAVGQCPRDSMRAFCTPVDLKLTIAHVVPQSTTSTCRSWRLCSRIAPQFRNYTITDGWTAAIAAGDILGVSVTSVAALTRVALSLTVQAP